MELDRANEALVKGNIEEANKRLKAADEFLKVALEKGFIEKNGSLFNKLNEKFTLVEQKYDKEAAKENPPTSTEPNYSGGGSNNVAYSSPGTYGPSSGVQIITGDVIISSRDVILQNAVIKGNLLISEDVGEGDVRLKNVKVEGQTLVKGGGQNSVYFEDTGLATVIVNKNNGVIRIVATGNTHVAKVQVESYVKMEESHLTNGADGFTDITVSDKVQSTNPGLSVQLVGSFEKIISNASNVRLNLDSQSDVSKLILNAAEVVADGRIDTAEINTDGSRITSVPQNTVVNNGVTVIVNNQQVTQSQYADLEGEVKFKLSWGNKPNLDSHLIGPNSEFEVFHTYPGNKNFQKDGINFADLEMDSTQPYGKETTTIRKLTDGRYIFYVKNNSQGDINQSEAEIQIFIGNEQMASHTFKVPTEESPADYWAVCALDVSQDGKSVEVLPINLLVDGELNIEYPNSFYHQPIEYLNIDLSYKEWLVTEAKEGTNPGEYESGAITEFKAIIDEVKLVANNPLSTLRELILAIWKIQDGYSKFAYKKNPELTDSIYRGYGYYDADQNNHFSLGDELFLTFIPKVNFDSILKDQNVVIQVANTTTSDTINFYKGSKVDDIQPTNLILSMSAKSDLVTQDTVILARSTGVEEGIEDSYRIVFTNLLTNDHTTNFSDGFQWGDPAIIEIGEALKNLYGQPTN